MKVSIPRMTIEEVDRLPDDGNRYELIDGELYVSAAPRTKHQRVLSDLHDFVSPFAKKHKLGLVFPGPTDVYLDPASQTRVEPDLLFVARHRLQIVEEKGVYGPPDLVVEILSESTYRADLFDKRDLYRRSGVPEYWIVDPDEGYILLYGFAESSEPRKLVRSDTLATPLLPGLEIPLSSLFGE